MAGIIVLHNKKAESIFVSWKLITCAATILMCSAGQRTEGDTLTIHLFNRLLPDLKARQVGTTSCRPLQIAPQGDNLPTALILSKWSKVQFSLLTCNTYSLHHQ
jgi:hypothetical protein